MICAGALGTRRGEVGVIATGVRKVKARGAGCSVRAGGAGQGDGCSPSAGTKVQEGGRSLARRIVEAK